MDDGLLADVRGFQAEGETLRAGDFLFVPARNRESGSPVLLKVYDESQSSGLPVEALEHERAMASRLDRSWALVPVDLFRHGSFEVLVLDGGFEGRPLSEWSVPLRLDRFFVVAQHLVAAVAAMHQHDVVHKDLRPENVFVSRDGDQVRLAGFGAAGLLSQERTRRQATAAVDGSLAYASPEQTGRMNRPIDLRSDLYSVGVIFYRLLTGDLPFEGPDPLDLAYGHMAVTPRPPRERNPAIPAALSAIAMKLLAKAPEDRYQSDAGLQADLETCRRRLLAGHEDPFPLGQSDASDRFVVSSKLYGRARESAALARAVARVGDAAAAVRPALVLVSGGAGVGKTSLVNELQPVVARLRANFGASKFDQQVRGKPYSSRLFDAVVQRLLRVPREQLEALRRRLLAAVGVNGKLIIAIAPSLERLIGPQPPVPELPAAQAQRRFHLVMGRFVEALARPEHPLVLFLDDLQWADTASLDVLQFLLSHPSIHSMCVIAAFRDSEVRADDPVAAFLRAVADAGVPSERIALGPLDLDGLRQLIADTLRCEPRRAAALARLVKEKTGGNPFFVTQFLHALHRERRIFFDHRRGEWHWDLAAVREASHTENVVEFLVRKLRGLPAPARRALETAALLGNRFEGETFATACGDGSEADPASALEQALVEGLVEHYGQLQYRFAHDRIQQAAYALIPESERAAAHLRLGRRLLSATATEELPGRSCDLVEHLNRGSALVEDASERIRFAELNLLAARKARDGAAYSAAAEYLAHAAAWLPAQPWDGDLYALAFAIHIEWAISAFLSHDFDRAEALFEQLFRRARNRIDRAEAYRHAIYLHTVKGENALAVELGIACLEGYGLGLSPHPSREEVDEASHRFFALMGDRSIESLAELPRMTDPEGIALIKLLVAFYAPALFTDFHLGRIVPFLMAELSARLGNAPASAVGFVSLGEILPGFGKYREGVRFGQLARELVRRHGDEALRGPVDFVFAHASFWLYPYAQVLRLLEGALQPTIDAGEITYANFCTNQMVNVLRVTGRPLKEVVAACDRHLEFAAATGYDDIGLILASMRRYALALCHGPQALAGEELFEQRVRREAMPIAVCYHEIFKLQAVLLLEGAEAALRQAAEVEPLLWTAGYFIHGTEYAFHRGLALAMGAGDPAVDAETRSARRRELDAIRGRFAIWASNCPDNFAHQRALLDAESERLTRDGPEALAAYESAIGLAARNGFLHGEALALERAGEFCLDRGLPRAAHGYLCGAMVLYHRWGAGAKVRQMARRHPELARDAARMERPAAATAADADFGALMRASRAIAGEIVFERLVAKLFQVCLEAAGAQRGVLVLEEEDGPHVRARGGAGAAVRVERTPLTDLEPLSRSILEEARARREPVVLDDAASDPRFAEQLGASPQRFAVRSALALPIERQSKLVATLCLENDLTPGAFAPGAVRLLGLLSAQIAIALENSLLYERTAQSVRARDEFLLVASHELRTPITSMILIVQGLLGAGRPPSRDTVARGLGRVQRQLRRLTRLIENLLDVSEIESGRIAPARERVDLAAVVDEAVKLTRDALAESGSTSRVSADRAVVGDWDQARLVRLMEALLENAIKFGEGKPIEVSVEGDDGLGRLIVADHGMGIAPERLLHVFERFERGVSAAHYGGLGLGLYIVRGIAEALGGSVRVESTVGVGTRVVVELPARQH